MVKYPPLLDVKIVMKITFQTMCFNPKFHWGQIGNFSASDHGLYIIDGIAKFANTQL